jgi:hypothetical protein
MLYYTRLERLYNDKHSSLFGPVVINEEKKFYEHGPRIPAEFGQDKVTKCRSDWWYLVLRLPKVTGDDNFLAKPST